MVKNYTTGKLFVGDSNGAKSFLKKNSGHYVYILRRPDLRPFYVGKGSEDRVFKHENEARHPNDRKSNAYKLNVIRSIWHSGQIVQYEIDFISSDPTSALDREAMLIGVIKRLHEGGPLTNLAPGGGSISGNAPASKEKHSATLGGIPDNNPERATINRFVLSIAYMNSVVIKPIKQFIPRPTQRFPNKTRQATLRQAVALVASAASNGVLMDAECEIPRLVQIEDVDGLVENGVSCDILTSEMARVVPANNPADEYFRLTADQSRKAVGLVGVRKCFDLGVLSSIG